MLFAEMSLRSGANGACEPLDPWIWFTDAKVDLHVQTAWERCVGKIDELVRMQWSATMEIDQTS